jgi:hypothetical protein
MKFSRKTTKVTQVAFEYSDVVGALVSRSTITCATCGSNMERARSCEEAPSGAETPFALDEGTTQSNGPSKEAGQTLDCLDSRTRTEI